MRNYLFITMLAVTVSFGFAHISFAQGCVVTGATPGGGEVAVCSGVDTNGLETTEFADDVTVEPDADLTNPGDHVIQTLGGNDYVEINGGMITGSPSDNFDCVFLNTGFNELLMIGGTLRCGEGITCSNDSTCKITVEGGVIDAIGTTGNGGEAIGISNDNNNEVYINGGMLTATDGVIQTGFGDDKIIITGGSLRQLDSSDNTIAAGSGNDLISVKNAVLDGLDAEDGQAIDAGGDDDTVRFGTAAEILGATSGRSGFDTLVFEMEVPIELVNSVCSQILSQDPEAGEITINGLLYEWVEFEALLCEVVGVRNPRPIPTLSEWGLIAMAGLIGIVGVMFVVRRKIVQDA